MIIAIDGPAGSGKSTIAKLIAKELNILYLDTGAMYRLITLKIIKENIDFNNIEEIKKVLLNFNIGIEGDKFFLDGENVTFEIRKAEISNNVSKIAKIKEVREKLVKLQREFSKSKNVILDGRDIGTVVFPEADLKIFLVANPMERAMRRYKEFQDKNVEITLEEILKNIEERDYIDTNREESPLKKAFDSIEVDTSYKGIDEVKTEILNICKEKNIYKIF